MYDDVSLVDDTSEDTVSSVVCRRRSRTDSDSDSDDTDMSSQSLDGADITQHPHIINYFVTYYVTSIRNLPRNLSHQMFLLHDAMHSVAYAVATCLSVRTFVYHTPVFHSSSSRMHVMNYNWSATKQHLHPQSVAQISRHSVLSGDRIRQCGTLFGSHYKDTDQWYGIYSDGDPPDRGAKCRGYDKIAIFNQIFDQYIALSWSECVVS